MGSFTEEQITQAVGLYASRPDLGIRAIGKLVGCSPTQLIRWVQERNVPRRGGPEREPARTGRVPPAVPYVEGTPENAIPWTPPRVPEQDAVRTGSVPVKRSGTPKENTLPCPRCGVEQSFDAGHPQVDAKYLCDDCGRLFVVRQVRDDK